MATLLAEGLTKLPGAALSQPVESNAVFISMPRVQIEKLQQSFAFAVWNEPANEIRLVASFDTTEEDVAAFLDAAAHAFSE
jgi:threonine aldolase